MGSERERVGGKRRGWRGEGRGVKGRREGGGEGRKGETVVIEGVWMGEEVIQSACDDHCLLACLLEGAGTTLSEGRGRASLV